MLKRFLEAGLIVGTHGLNGEVRIDPWCDSPDFLKEFKGFYLEAGEKYFKAEWVKTRKSIAIVKFAGIDNIDAAAGINRKIIYIDRTWVTLPKGSYFEQDLIGLEVLDADTGENYGILNEVAKTGANDIYRVDKDGRETWIPAAGGTVKSVDLENGRMLISPVKGLFHDAD